MKLKGKLLELVLPQLISILLSAFPEDSIKRGLDSAIDILERSIEESETKIDDMALPVLKVLRGVFSIPDLPDNA